MIVDVYAKALFNLAKDHEKWLRELEDLSTIFNTGLLNFFSSPLISLNQKETVLTKTLKEQLDPELLNFILILLKKKRFHYFPDIVQAYKAKVYDKMGIIDGLLITPRVVTEDTKKSLADKWGMLLDKKIIMKEEIDQSLIGGGIFKFKDKRIDFSLRGKLERLQRTMRTS